MSARRGSLGILLMLTALPVFSSGCLAYDASRLYRAGRMAATEGRPANAVVYLTQAIAKQPREEGKVRVYGSNFEPYLPHFYLGLAFFNLGQYGSAIDAWKNSEEQGIIQKTPEYRELHEKRDLFLREIFPAIVRTRRGELEEAASTLQAAGDLLGVVRAVGAEPEDLELRSGRVTETLTRAGESLDAGEKGQDLRRLEESRAAVSVAQLEAVKLLREAQGRVAAVTAVQADAGLAESRAALDAGGCQRDALARLASLRRLVVFRPELGSAERETGLSLGLARAFLQCGEIEPAAQNLMSIPVDSAPAGEKALLERQLAEKREQQLHAELEDFEVREAALAGFVETAAAIDAGECDPAAVERLQLTAEAVRQRTDRRQLGAWIGERAGLSYIPQLYLAKAYRRCGDVEKADRSLNRSKERKEELSVGYEREAESIQAWSRGEQIKNLYSGSHALILLASDYKHWEKLPGVAAERKEIEEKLTKIGFPNPEIVFNPTKKDLEGAVERFIAAYGKGAGNRNRLLIYYAGHGETLMTPPYEGKTTPLGYLVPVDAAREPVREEDFGAFIDTAVGMDKLNEWAKKIESLHAVFILDSCYSGAIFREIYRTRGGTLPAGVRKAAAEKVRYFFTAGSAEQKVPDTGLFLRTLLAALTGEVDADLIKDGFLLGGEVCLFLKGREDLFQAGISPECGTMPPPYDKGDVIFLTPQPESKPAADPGAHAAAEALQSDLAFWKATAKPGSAEDYRGYLQRFPNGRFAGLARYRLLKLGQPGP